VAGIRPSDWGFSGVTVRPLAETFDSIDAVVPHPAGLVEVRLRKDDRLHGSTIVLPNGVEGVYVEPLSGEKTPLHSGVNHL
jgi:hypothetical protein